MWFYPAVQSKEAFWSWTTYPPVQVEPCGLEPHLTRVSPFGFTYRSGFATYFFFGSLHLGPVAVFQALTRGCQAHTMVVPVQTTVATGPTVMDRLITDKKRYRVLNEVLKVSTLFSFNNLVLISQPNIFNICILSLPASVINNSFFYNLYCVSLTSIHNHPLTCSRSRWICSVNSWMSESAVFISTKVEAGAAKTSSFTGPLIQNKPADQLLH